MAQFEYKVVPAPKRGLKARGLKGAEAQFANALATLMNAEAADGWEYQRTDSLPCEERQGLTGRVTVFQNMLVFRRSLTVEAPVTMAPEAAQTLAIPVEQPVPAIAPFIERDATAATAPSLQSPDPRIAQTLTRGDDAMVPRHGLRAEPEPAQGRNVAAE